MRLVDADALQKDPLFLLAVDNYGISEIIEALPTVDAEPIRHGHWIERTKVHSDLLNESTYNYECSKCGYMDTHGANVEVPYCWHYGAKVDEEDRNDIRR